MDVAPLSIASLAMRDSSPIAGALCGLGSAALFGISAPLAKLLLPMVDAWILAGLLYLGVGLGLVAWRAAQWTMLLGLERRGRTAAELRGRLHRAPGRDRVR
jgi:drug/metabolite transporter (DMT)-like permease